MPRIDQYLNANPDKYPVTEGKMTVEDAKRLATDFAKLPKKEKVVQTELIEHDIVKYIKKNLPNVARLTLPTFEQCEEMIAKCGKKFISDSLKAMENIPDLSKKYKYVHLTIENWYRRSNGNPQEQTTGKKLKEL